MRVMAQLTLALKECHRRSDGRATVLHRDLKPANIFLNIKQNVKLGDFGLARILNHDTSFAKTFVGTPYYMSPVSVHHHDDDSDQGSGSGSTAGQCRRLYNVLCLVYFSGANQPAVLQREVGYLVPGLLALRTLCAVVSRPHHRLLRFTIRDVFVD